MGTLGELVKKWRVAAGLSQPEMARRIGHGVKYQNLQQLESGKAEQPKYLMHLAYFMRTTADDLLALRMPPPYDPKAPPGPAERSAPRPTAPGQDEALLPLQDDEPHLITAYRLLDQQQRKDVLGAIEQMLLEKHGPLMETMQRLNLLRRADDSSVNAALAPAPPPPPPPPKPPNNVNDRLRDVIVSTQQSEIEAARERRAAMEAEAGGLRKSRSQKAPKGHGHSTRGKGPSK